MPEKNEEREILLTLARRLPEKLLQELLPREEPDAVRQLLARLAGVTSVPVRPAPEQKALFKAGSGHQTGKACTLYTDGAARGNPGEAGAGAVLVGPDGAELGVRSLYLGQCTNNVAEYQALIAGLELAGRSGCRVLKICLDSELIVRQIQGAYKVKNAHLKPLYEKVRSNLAKLEKWEIRHVPREENARADALANQGIDDKE